MSGGTTDRAIWLEQYRRALIEAGASDDEIRLLSGPRSLLTYSENPDQEAKANLIKQRYGA